MLISLVLISAIMRYNPEGAPIHTSTIHQCHCDESIEIYLRNNTSTNSHFGTRARNDIIISCLATILACTWTTIHPNVPAPGESGWDSLKRKIVTWLYALLAPEAITAWAMRQYFAAQWIADRYNSDFVDTIKRPLKKRTMCEQITKYAHEWIHGSALSEELGKGEIRPWTVTHGFFLQMGGFMRCRNGRPVSCYRRYGSFSGDIINKRIDAPIITESEIQDRSKGDTLSRIIVILQTMWFITQCIVRWSAHLPVTELEIVTLGFAMLNALTYGFWWNKPQSVGVPVFLETKSESRDEGKTSGGEEGGQALKQTHIAKVYRKAVLKIKPHRSFFIRQWYEDKRHPRWQCLWRTPYALMLAVLRPLAKLLQFTATDGSKWDLRVPMFHTYGSKNETIYIASSVIASLFGLVHFIPAWFLDFPSHPEMVLWRVSAGIITGQPIILGAWSKWKKGEVGWIETTWGTPSPILNAISLAGVPLYIIARLMLIVLAFLALRDLSQEALLSFDWISFVPHL